MNGERQTIALLTDFGTRDPYVAAMKGVIGNLVTDVEAARLPFARFAVKAGDVTITRVARAYGEAGAGPFLITGSTGCIEISIANGSAAALLQLGRGDRVMIIPT